MSSTLRRGILYFQPEEPRLRFRGIHFHVDRSVLRVDSTGGGLERCAQGRCFVQLVVGIKVRPFQCHLADGAGDLQQREFETERRQFIDAEAQETIGREEVRPAVLVEVGGHDPRRRPWALA